MGNTAEWFSTFASIMKEKATHMESSKWGPIEVVDRNLMLIADAVKETISEMLMDDD